MTLSVEDTKRAWNPRFVAYALVHGRNPEVQLTQDTEKFPGGKMCGFMLWMSDRWAAFYQSRGWKRDHIKSQQDHVDFDKWLADFAMSNGVCGALCCNKVPLS